MSTRRARGRRLVPLALALLGVLAAPGAIHAQEDPSAVAARVHSEGGYPEDISVLDDETDETTLANGGDGTGAGNGPQGSVHPDGERDGGEASGGLDIPLPQFVRDLLDALGRMIGAAAPTLTYVFFALGLALLVVFVVYLVTLLRFPKRDLSTLRRAIRPDASAMDVDPLLEEAHATPEEYARQGRFREAIHAVFVRALKEMARSGDVDRRGRTAREVVTAIARIQAAPPELADLLALTELVWFGGRAATESQYVHATSLAERIRSTAAGITPSPRDARPSAESP
jgi:hypothetical protein